MSRLNLPHGYGLKLSRCCLQFKKKIVVWFIINFGTLSFPIGLVVCRRCCKDETAQCRDVGNLCWFRQTIKGIVKRADRIERSCVVLAVSWRYRRSVGCSQRWQRHWHHSWRITGCSRSSDIALWTVRPPTGQWQQRRNKDAVTWLVTRFQNGDVR